MLCYLTPYLLSQCQDVKRIHLPELRNANVLEVHDCAAGLDEVTLILGAHWQSLALELLVLDDKLLQLTFLGRAGDIDECCAIRRRCSTGYRRGGPSNSHIVKRFDVKLAQLLNVHWSTVLRAPQIVS